MRYLPLTEAEKQNILGLCGVGSFQELVSSIPEELQLKGLLDLEPGLSEMEIIGRISKLAKKNKAAGMVSYLGQGAYDHSWPVVIDQITNRGEFLTAYTPYQPEVAQGTLQAIFEFQSMIAEILGLEVANASLYDGSTAVVEAVLMASRIQAKKTGRILVSEGTYPHVMEVLRTYLTPLGISIETWVSDPSTLLVSASALEKQLGGSQPTDIIGIVLQSPNRFGLVEDWAELKFASQNLKATSIGFVSHPHALALFESPGEADIDLAVSEGQSLGIPVGFGGPYLGLFACRKKDVRQMPGRLVGLTEDANRQRAFCITLSTREQHIRRERATSNICSNQSLMALRATVYLSLMGREGFRRVAELSRAAAHYARQGLKALLNKEARDLVVVEGEAFNEISILVPSKYALWPETLQAAAESQNILAGLSIDVPRASSFVSGLAFAFTEKHEKKDIDDLLRVVELTLKKFHK